MVLSLRTECCPVPQLFDPELTWLAHFQFRGYIYLPHWNFHPERKCSLCHDYYWLSRRYPFRRAQPVSHSKPSLRTPAWVYIPHSPLTRHSLSKSTRLCYLAFAYVAQYSFMRSTRCRLKSNGLRCIYSRRPPSHPYSLTTNDWYWVMWVQRQQRDQYPGQKRQR